jgi:hypothetical protein
MHSPPRASVLPKQVDHLPVLVEVVPVSLLRAMVEARRIQSAPAPDTCEFELDLPIAPGAYRKLQPRGVA